MERVLNSIVVAVCAFAAGLAVAHTLRAGDSKAKNKEKGKVNGMAKNEGKSKETPAKATESKQQNTGKSGWNRIIRIKADKTALVKPAIAYGASVGAFVVAVAIALIVLL